MKLIKAYLSLVLVLVMCVSCFMVAPMTANAGIQDVASLGTQSRSDYYSKSYSLTGDGATDIVAVARAQVGKTKSNLAYTEAWCADFVSDCAKLAGQSAAVPFNGGVSYMYNAVLNAGGYKVSTAQAGDLVFYYCTSVNSFCHVAVMTDSVNSIQGNVNNMVMDIKYNHYRDQYGACYTATFVRPAYGGSTALFGDPVNLGDNFYASLTKSDSGVYVANVNGNVELADHNIISDYAHIWRFVRQSDNSYLLYNCADGNVMDVANAGKVEGTNVCMCPFLDNDAQKWFLYKQSNGAYVLRPKLCYLVLDVASGKNDFGTNLHLWSYNSSGAQMFNIIMQPDVKAPVITVEAGDYKTLTTFKCETEVTPVCYDLSINKVTDEGVTSFATINMVQNDTFMYELPQGKYQAYAQVSNGYSTAKSDVVSFEVYGEPVVGDDGWTYSEKLYSDINSEAYEIEYLHTYSKISSESPGEGWVKGEFAKKEYVNSGESYWSAIELPVSETRTLLNYIYYHYCGGSTGNNANFAATGAYVHYDWLPKDSVYEHSAHADYDDSRYKYYHLKWSDGRDAYCSSGVSCDGSFGSHGNRSCYWYKNSQYQDKTAIDCYYYSKPAEWTTVPDETADSVTYRYKLRKNGVFGDANGDGRVSIGDATTIQKHCASLIVIPDERITLSDTDRNGRISVTDATRIQKYLVELIPEL